MFNADKIAFIASSPRSGSTLLIRILNCHSKIAAPCEIAIPAYFHGDQKERLVLEKYRQICRYYGADPEQSIRDQNILFNELLKFEGKEFLVAKDPRQSLFLTEICSDYPSACIIHLVRDARAVASSIMFRGKPQVGLKRWYDFNSAIISAGNSIATAKRIVIHYEDIVSRPGETFDRLVSFLGYQFEPDMLDYGKFKHADDEMKLWHGARPDAREKRSLSSPQDSYLQASLNAGSIYNHADEYDDEALALYSRSPEVRRMNESFGY